MARKYATEALFEIRSEETPTPLAFGLRYDSIIRRLGFKKDLPSVGVKLVYSSKEAKFKAVKKVFRKPKFFFIQLGFDASLGMWATFVIKLLLGLAVVVVLDMFCGIGLSVVSWFLVAAPFIITSLATAIAMGTDFDAIVISQVSTKEKFFGGDKMELVPAASNEVK